MRNVASKQAGVSLRRTATDRVCYERGNKERSKMRGRENTEAVEKARMKA